jgi:hypothetical protein
VTHVLAFFFTFGQATLLNHNKATPTENTNQAHLPLLKYNCHRQSERFFPAKMFKSAGTALDKSGRRDAASTTSETLVI